MALKSCQSSRGTDAKCNAVSTTLGSSFVTGLCTEVYDSAPDNTLALCPSAATALKNTCVSACTGCTGYTKAATAGVCLVTPTTCTSFTGCNTLTHTAKVGTTVCAGSTCTVTECCTAKTPTPTPGTPTPAPAPTTTSVSAGLKRTKSSRRRRLEAEVCGATGEDEWVRYVITEAEKATEVHKAYYVKCDTSVHTFLFDIVGDKLSLAAAKTELKTALSGIPKIESLANWTVKLKTDETPAEQSCSAVTSLTCTSPAVTDTAKKCPNKCIATDFGAATTLCCKTDSVIIGTDAAGSVKPTIFALFVFLSVFIFV
jgi:hypothetical protein